MGALGLAGEAQGTFRAGGGKTLDRCLGLEGPGVGKGEVFAGNNRALLLLLTERMDTNQLMQLIISLAAQKAAAAAVAESDSVSIWRMILAALGPLLGAATIYYAREAMTKATMAVTKSEESKDEIVLLKDNVNGKMGELVKATKEAAYQNGASAQRATQALVEAAHAKGAAETAQVAKETAKEAE